MNRLRAGISRRVHDRRVQTRLQAGSALGLGIGLLTAALIVAGWLTPISERATQWLVALSVSTPDVPTSQDLLSQIILIFLLAIVAGITLPNVRFLSAAALTLIYIALYLSYAFDKFSQGVLVQPLYPTLALVLMFLCSMLFRYLSEERRRAALVRLLRRYVGPDAVERVTSDLDTGALPLDGVKRTVSLLAIDLTELEPLSQSLPPQALIRLLDQYTALIVGVVFRLNGTLVRSSGETILAAWNLLFDQPTHAREAVRAALELREELRRFHRRQPQGLGIKIGMGIATGVVAAGGIGASTRAEYTLIGEVVGMAERIALKPERGIFLDAATRAHVGEEFDLRMVNPVRLRRRTDPSEVWQLVEPVEVGEEERTETVAAVAREEASS